MKTNMEKLKHQVSTMRIIALVLPLLLILVAIIVTFLADKRVTTFLRQRQDAAAVIQTQKETDEFSLFISKHENELEMIDYAVPGEVMMEGVISDIEGIIKTYDQKGSIKFVSTTPIRIGAELTIPITLKLQMSTLQVPDFLEQIKRLPYGLQLLTLDNQINNDVADVTCNMRLYVQEPFAGI